jgi:capsular exopolysaccharide synthesis family protein
MATVIYGSGEDAVVSPRSEYAYEGEAEGLSIGPLLRHVLSVARRNIWLIIAIIGVFVAAAAVITILTMPRYTATSSIEIANETQQVLGEQFDQTTEEADSWDIDRFLITQVAILQSRSLADRVAQKLNLYSDPRFFNAMQVDPESFETRTSLRNGVLGLLAQNLNVALPGDSRIVDISFTSTDRQVSAQVANAFATEFIQSNLQRRFDSSSYARNFVQDQLGEARARLEQSEQELNDYARSASLIRTRDNTEDGNGSSSVTTNSLLQLNEAANQAHAQRVLAEARWNAERAQPLLSSPAALNSPVVQDLQKRRGELLTSLENARERYLDDHPSVQRLSQDLATVNAQLTEAASQARDAVRTQLVAAQTSENELRQRVDQLEGATLREQDRAVRYNTIAREADTNRSIYEGLLQRYRELNASAGITASNVSIIDTAEPPVSPSAPNPVLNVLIALVLGTLTAAAIVFLKEQLDDRIRIPEEIEQKVGVNLLGVVPKSADEDPVEELLDPKSPVAESYSALRSSLLYSTREGLPPLVLVTSAQPSEGKSTTSYAIARSMALIGKRSLLIDADLRRPSVHKLAGIENKVGLSSILVGESSPDEAVQSGDLPNFFILPSGPVPPSPAELLSSSRLNALLKALRGQYDSIFIDSAPVLGLADSPGLSALADGVLLVVEANRGRGGQLKSAVRRLRMMKPTILGAVLTKFDPSAAGNAYTTYYQYDYYTYRSQSA